MRSRLAALAIPLLLVGCGLKMQIPDQIPSSGGFADADYEVTYRWLIPGVTDLLIARHSNIFYVIQHEDSLSIYQAYKREDMVTPDHWNLFDGLVSPRYLADGRDDAARLWVWDEGDGRLKAYDGSEFLAVQQPQLSWQDGDWGEVVAIAADDDGHLFVADRGANRIWRYEVSTGPSGLELAADGEVGWISQGTGATVRDICFAGTRLLLLDDALMTVQKLVPDADDTSGAEAFYLSDVLAAPTSISSDGEAIIVIDPGSGKVWDFGWEASADEVLRVDKDDKVTLADPIGTVLNGGKVYVADPVLEMVIDYEKRQ